MNSNGISASDYRQWMAHLRSLPAYALVTTGRTGSDFLQSLLDSHPEVLTFNGHTMVHTEFFETAASFKHKPVSARDAADEFVGRYLYKLISRYDIQEGKDRLGENGDESFTLDTHEFKTHVLGLLGGAEVTTKTFLLAVYGAYNLCLGHDLLQTRIFFHHPHLLDEFGEFRKDFPQTGVVVTTRDPRANFVSHVEHFRRYSERHDNEHHLYVCLKMILEDSMPMEHSGLRYVAVRLEDLPHEATLIKFSEWLGITYHDCLLRSTWAGLDWHGDRISGRTFASTGWSPTRTENRWRERLGMMDQYVLNFLLNARLEHYRYPCRPTHWWDVVLVACLLPLPMKHERRFLSVRYVWRQLRKGTLMALSQLAVTPYFYAKRVRLCYRHYVHALRGRGFSGPWVGCPESLSPLAKNGHQGASAIPDVVR